MSCFCKWYQSGDEKYQINGECIFHCRKDDWYEEKVDFDGKKIRDWSVEMGQAGKVTKFWKAIREKLKQERNDENCEEHDFSGFIFPRVENYEYYDVKKVRDELCIAKRIRNDREGEIFRIKKEASFWEKEEEITFVKSANFSKATFLGEMSFFKAVFFKEADFSKVNFLDNAIFLSVIFLSQAEFSRTKFFKDAHFGAYFLAKANFFDATFLNNAYFNVTVFLGEAEFFAANFKKEVTFIGSEFLEKAQFSQVNFEGETDFSIATFSGQADFGKAKFSAERRTLFESVRFLGYNQKKKNISAALFEEIIFSEKVIFRLCDLSRISFLKSNIEKIRFDECDWGKLGSPILSRHEKEEDRCIIGFCPSEKRKILWNEYVLQNYAKNLYFNESPAQEYYQVANLNRQLKKNFDDKKDYQIGDDFYVGEMEMRVSALRAERSWRFWKNGSALFFLWFYRNISNYNSSPLRALAWLFVSAGIFYFLYAFFLLDIDLNFKDISGASFWSFQAVQFSLTSTVPFFDFPEDLKEESEKIIISFHYIQRILSIIVWSLLVLSLHRKFKR